MSLTPKQEAFCREYVIDYNGKQAAIRAGYSAKTANEQASQNLTKLNVLNFIEELRDEQMKDHKIQVEDILTRLLREADDMEGGTGGSRVSALVALGKHLGMFVDRVDVTGSTKFESITRTIIDPDEDDDDDDDYDGDATLVVQ